MHSLYKATTFVSDLSTPSGPSLRELEKRDNITLPAPIVAVPSLHWEGVDGTWSTFEIRVGTPSATYRVLPATSWQETWVIYSAAADTCNTTAGVSADCAESRGGLFNSASSSTWESGAQYALGLNEQLGYGGVGQYGFDTVGLGYTNDTGPTLPHQIVAEIVSDDWWFGMLGMGFQPTNFSGYGNPQASFSDTLYSNGSIASMSWSYTAGAIYRLKGVVGSLIFGGYDKSRYTENGVRFTMTQDNLRDIVVTIRSITSMTTSGNTTLMSSPEFAFIDSTVPELWLPLEVCQAFERAFGLTLDAASGLYLLNSSTHSSLQSLNPNITITLSDQKATNGPTTDIILPYSAFDLNISAPALPNSTGTFYFPLRRASDSSEYTLGRTFLQEAYVTAHYNSRTFNVSQCVFSDPLSAEVIALPSNLPTTSSTPSPSSSSTPGSGGSGNHKGLGGGAIAGIVIGVLAFFILLGILLLFCLRRRRRAAEDRRPRSPVHEIDAGKRVDPAESSAYSEQASKTTMEVGGREKYEKDGWPVMQPQELEADVPADRTGLGTVPEDRQLIEMAGANGHGRHSPSPVESNERTFDDDHIVSPNTETGTMPPLSAATERFRSGSLASEMGRSTPSPTSAGGWGAGRTGSRFEESI